MSYFAKVKGTDGECILVNIDQIGMIYEEDGLYYLTLPGLSHQPLDAQNAQILFDAIGTSL